MATPGIENLENPRKKNKKENLGDHSHCPQPSYVFDFPDDVLVNIFSFLPIKRAIQASTVSPRFKESWLFSRKLCFHKDFAKRHKQKDFMNIVNRVFDLHLGSNIQTFSLFVDPTGVEDTVENWIQMSIDKGVQELELNFTPAKIPYKISSDFVDVKTIKTLKLCRCELDLLPTFQGFNSLQTLVLKRIEINAKSIETVFFNCMSLETLELVQCRRIGHLKIFAQNLRSFKALKVAHCLDLCHIDIHAPTIRSIYYSGKLIFFQFVDIFQLNDVILDFKPLKGFGKFFKNRSFLCDLSHVTVLSASSTLLEDLSPGLFDQRALELNFSNLKELQLFMAGAIFCNLYDIAHFLKKCPCLEKLFIDLNGFTFETREYWEQIQRPLVERYRQPLKCLEFIKFEGFKFEEHEIAVVKYLLERAIALDTLVLVAPKTAKQGIIRVRNIPFCRKICNDCPISPIAKVRFYCTDDDQSPGPKHSNTWYYRSVSGN